MTCSTTTLRAALVALLTLSAGAVLPALGQSGPGSVRPGAVPGLAPSVAAGQLPGIAWTATDVRGAPRVFAAIPAETPGAEVGPALEGHDGAPSLVASGSGFLLVASRRSGSGSRIWYRRWRQGAWEPTGLAPRAGVHNEHPALAGNDRAVWLVWVATARHRGAESLFAARWTGRRWTDPERLPTTHGRPMAPAIAVDSRGHPAVVWAALDGEDAEIWFSRRARGTWTPPVALSANNRHDILPDIAFVADRPVVAWSAFTRRGYVPVVATQDGRRRWSEPQALSGGVGSNPKVVTARTGPGVVWAAASPSDDGYGSVIRTATLESGRWSEPADLAKASNARIDAVSGPTPGSIIVGWLDGDRAVAASGVDQSIGDGRHRGFDLRPLNGSRLDRAPRDGAAYTVTLPGTYIGFGDSITEGTVRFDGVISLAEPYTVRLGTLISALTGQTVTVDMEGLGGEFTAEGIARLRALLAVSSAEFVLIMEGANDVANRVDPLVTFANLHEMVRVVKEAGRIPVIASITPRTEAGFSGPFNERTEEINALLMPMTRAEAAVFVDQYAAFLFKAHLYSDVLHPNQDGYHFMADVWYRGIQPILQHLLQHEETTLDSAKDAVLFPPSMPGARRIIQ